jgi:hypothetical protein
LIDFDLIDETMFIKVFCKAFQKTTVAIVMRMVIIFYTLKHQHCTIYFSERTTPSFIRMVFWENSVIIWVRHQDCGPLACKSVNNSITSFPFLLSRFVGSSARIIFGSLIKASQPLHVVVVLRKVAAENVSIGENS